MKPLPAPEVPGSTDDWVISTHSSTYVRHEVVAPGTFKVDGNTVTFLYHGLTEKAEIPEYQEKPTIYIGADGKVVIEPEFWAGMDKVRAQHERDEEWQRKGYPVEFRAFMIRTLKRLSVERAGVLPPK